MGRAEVFAWNPSRAPFGGPLAALYPWKKPVNNFGDLLGPLIVRLLAEENGRDPARAIGSWQLMSVGSVLHLARDGAVVWGAGINGKVDQKLLQFRDLDVRAVRGPRTAAVLRARGITVPEVFGDPGLLVPDLFPDLLGEASAYGRRSYCIVPNLHDYAAISQSHRDAVVVNPRSSVRQVVATIARSEFVIASSLHGLVVAEAFGIPARMLTPSMEPAFKYQDYYEGTGRPDFRAATSVEEAVTLGGERPLDWDSQPLRDAFPADLWEASTARKNDSGDDRLDRGRA